MRNTLEQISLKFLFAIWSSHCVWKVYFDDMIEFFISSDSITKQVDIYLATSSSPPLVLSRLRSFPPPLLLSSRCLVSSPPPFLLFLCSPLEDNRKIKGGTVKHIRNQASISLFMKLTLRIILKKSIFTICMAETRPVALPSPPLLSSPLQFLSFPPPPPRS